MMLLDEFTKDQNFSVQLFGMHDLHSPYFRPWQIITHVFMHGGFAHLFSNMFALIIYGPYIERVWGPKKFLFYYLFTAFGAVALHSGIGYIETNKLTQSYDQFITDPNADNFLTFSEKNPDAAQQLSFQKGKEIISPEKFAILWSENKNDASFKDLALSSVHQYWDGFVPPRDMPVVGASGAVFGLIIAFGIMFSEVLLYLYFLFPIKAKYIVLLHGGYEIYKAFMNNPGDNVAHFAHIGGMIFGYILIKYWQHKKNSIF